MSCEEIERQLIELSVKVKSNTPCEEISAELLTLSKEVRRAFEQVRNKTIDEIVERIQKK